MIELLACFHVALIIADGLLHMPYMAHVKLLLMQVVRLVQREHPASDSGMLGPARVGLDVGRMSSLGMEKRMNRCCRDSTGCTWPWVLCPCNGESAWVSVPH